MRRRLLTLFALATTATILLTPSFASAAELGEGVILDEYQRDAVTHFTHRQGCVETRFTVHAVNIHQDWIDGSVYDSNFGGLHAFSWNACTDQTIFDIELYSDALRAKVHHQIAGASVQGQEMTNNTYGDDELLVTLNVRWAPQGPLSARDSSEEIVAFNLATGEDVPALQEATEYNRRAMARGTITIGNQTFQLLSHDHETAIYGFENTWTELAQH